MAERLSVIIALSTTGESDVSGMSGLLEFLDQQVEDVDGETIRLNVAGEGELARTNALLGIMNSQLHDIRNVGIPGVGGAGGGALSEADRQADSFLRNLKEGKIRMSDLHDALAQVVPLLLVFVGALPALISGVLAFAGAAIAAAGALAAFTGVGLLGFAMQGPGGIQEGLQRIIDLIQRDFMDAFRPLAEELAPAFERGLEGLSRFFDAVAAQSGVFLALEDDFASFGQAIIDTVPDILASLSRLVDVSMPLFNTILRGLGDVGIGRVLADVLAETVPAMAALLDELMQIFPVLLQVSVGFLRIASAIITILDAFGSLLSILPVSAEAIGILLSTVLTLGGAWLLLNGIITNAVIPGLISLGKTILGASIPSLSSLSATLSSVSVSSIAAAFSIRTLAAALLGLAAVTVVGVVLAGIAGIAANALSASSNIDEMTSSLQKFKDVADGIGDSPFGAPDPGFQPGSLATAGPTGEKVSVTVAAREEGDRERLTSPRDSATPRQRLS